MPDLKAAAMFLRMAGKDLKAVRGMQGGQPFEDEIFGFHVQQAVEKALKAWLCLVIEKVPRIHDLHELTSLLSEGGQQVPAEYTTLVDFTDFAVEFRYSELALDADCDRAAVADSVEALLGYVEAIVVEAEGAAADGGRGDAAT